MRPYILYYKNSSGKCKDLILIFFIVLPPARIVPNAPLLIITLVDLPSTTNKFTHMFTPALFTVGRLIKVGIIIVTGVIII